jgi:hypothetical protein
VSGGSLQWTGDTGLIGSFKVPDAKRFVRTFCTTCGGPLPKDIPDMDLVMIPAGTLAVCRRLVLRITRASWRQRPQISKRGI